MYIIGPLVKTTCVVANHENYIVLYYNIQEAAQNAFGIHPRTKSYYTLKS